MDILEKFVEKSENGAGFEPAEIAALLALETPEEIRDLRQAAYAVKVRNVGKKVNLRGLIEIGNRCKKNCFYCGIRSGNPKIRRFMLNSDEILADAGLAWKFGYGSVVLQGGELDDSSYVVWIEEIVREIKRISNHELGITLSLGEQSLETYQRWFEAGAHRYLLRIETSNPENYRRLHPADHLFEKRLEALQLIRRAGFQLGSGVMFGFSGQTYGDMAADLEFLKKLDVDMVGMGPYSIHHDTPMGKTHPPIDGKKQLQLGLKMIAVLRLMMPDINIASTTVLQALSPHGREDGLLSGANVIMPNVSEVANRRAYQLYDNKPGVDENAIESRTALEKSIDAIGESINYGQWGDSLHFRNRKI